MVTKPIPVKTYSDTKQLATVQSMSTVLITHQCDSMKVQQVRLFGRLLTLRPLCNFFLASKQATSRKYERLFQSVMLFRTSSSSKYFDSNFDLNFDSMTNQSSYWCKDDRLPLSQYNVLRTKYLIFARWMLVIVDNKKVKLTMSELY